MTDLDDILSVREAAELAGKREESIRKAMYRGSLRAKKVTDKAWVTTRDELAAWLAWTPVHRRNAKTGRYLRGL